MRSSPAVLSRVAAGLLLASHLGGAVGQAKLYLTKDEALRVAFGSDATIDRRAVFLTDEQLAAARDLAGDGVVIKGALVSQYVGSAEGRVLGTAYFDTHPVRTLQETIMVVVSPDGTVDRVEILSFSEPEEYLPRKAWLEQFNGRPLDGELAVRRSIHGITGATLSARAVTAATRRILALHRVLSSGESDIDDAVGVEP